MRPVRTVAVYCLGIFVGSALAAPWLFKLLQGLAGMVPALNGLAAIPFPRYFNRILMLTGLLGLWPLARALGIRSWQDLGLKKSNAAWREMAVGFLFGFGSLACIAMAVLISGTRAYAAEHSAAEVMRHLANASSAAIAVSFIEETFFRGILFGGLRKSLAWPIALGLSSAIYASLHFLQRTEFTGPVDWTAGFAVLGSMLEGFGNIEQLIPGFLNLALAGMVLGLAYQWTGALYFPIGLHAGWVFWLKSYAFLSRDGVEGRHWFWGTGKLIDGFLALVVLAVMLCLLLRIKPQPKAD